MSASILNPDGTVANTGTLTGGATAHAVLSDGNDATYVALTNGQLAWCSLGAPSPSIPGTARILRLDLYVRAFGFGWGTDPPIVEAGIYGTGYSVVKTSVPVTSLRTWVATYVDGAFDPGDASFSIKNIGQSSLVVCGASMVATWVAKPVVDVTDVSPDPLTENNRPTLGWANTLDAAGGGQFQAELKVFTDAVYGGGGFDPDTSTPYLEADIAGAGVSHRFAEILENDTYRAYVRVAQWPNFQGELFRSDWAYDQFTVNVPLPAVPNLSVSAEPAASPVGRVKLTLTANSGDATTNAFQVQKLIDGAWEDLRTVDGDGVVGTVPATIYDYESEVGETLTYRARAIHHYSESDAYSDWTADQTTTLSPTSWALVHPTIPSESINVELRSFAGHSREARKSIKQPLGRPDAVVISDVRGPESGEIVIRLSDDAVRDAVMAAVGLDVPLYLRPAVGHHERSRWVTFGNEQITRVVDQSWIDERDGSYEWTEVAAPIGNLTAWT